MNNEKKIVIAIDGLTGTGKGTTAQGVAEKLGYIYLDTGAMYRATTLFAIDNNIIDSSNKDKIAMMKDINIGFIRNDQHGHSDVTLNGINVENIIRKNYVAMEIYKIANVDGIRKSLAEQQKNFGKHGGLVADGRDMGTVVFPDAEVKVFLTCDIEPRAQRRQKQLLEKGDSISIEAIKKEIEHRDWEDYLGPNAINKKAGDAIEIDTTHLTIDEQIERVLRLARTEILET